MSDKIYIGDTVEVGGRRFRVTGFGWTGDVLDRVTLSVGSQARVGDKVHVAGTVQKVGDGGLSVRFGDSDVSVPVSWPDVKHHEPAPRPLTVGDRVQRGYWCGEILAINGDRAWIKYDDGAFGTSLLCDLERI